MTLDSSEVERALSALIGLPLWAAGRASTMLWLQLGAEVHAPTDRDPDRITGEYALHVQCAWRVSSETTIVVESRDMYEPADPSQRWTFDAGDARGAVADARLATWMAAFAGRRLVVRSIDVDETGGFRLSLSDGFTFEAIAESPIDRDPETEQWRLFQPGRESRHFVV